MSSGSPQSRDNTGGMRARQILTVLIASQPAIARPGTEAGPGLLGTYSEELPVVLEVEPIIPTLQVKKQ